MRDWGIFQKICGDFKVPPGLRASGGKAGCKQSEQDDEGLGHGSGRGNGEAFPREFKGMLIREC